MSPSSEIGQDCWHGTLIQIHTFGHGEQKRGWWQTTSAKETRLMTSPERVHQIAEAWQDFAEMEMAPHPLTPPPASLLPLRTLALSARFRGDGKNHSVPEVGMLISKPPRGRKTPLGFLKGRLRVLFFTPGTLVFFYWTIRISTLVKMTEREPLPSLLHTSPLFGFLLVCVSFIFGRVKVLPLVSLEKGQQSTSAQVVSIWESRDKARLARAGETSVKV